MGNSFSSPTKDETRRTNRLSKPLTKRASNLNAPQLPPLETDPSELASGLIGWQNPWVGSSISKDVQQNKSTKKREAPSQAILSEPSTPNLSEGKTATEVSVPVLPQPAQVQDVEPLSPLSGSLSASSSVRRASYQTGSLGASSRPSLDLGRPKRANSFQASFQRHRSVIYGDKAHEATSSNTHFTVGNQRFSLTRRRSLLTRPGLATRRTTAAASRRFPSPIGEPDVSVEDHSDSNALQWPLPPLKRSSLPVSSSQTSSSMRPTSPTDPRYTQLGALKLGSLRVVNGSASPCPSERIPLGQSTQVDGSGLAPDRLETMRSKGTKIKIPAVPDLQKSDDVPGSPFSFEKSPTITVQPRSKTIFPTEAEDEGIAMCDESLTQSSSEKTPIGTVIDRSTSRSLNKTDSGYSSATSVHSEYRSRTRASFDSQTSGSCTAESNRSILGGNEKPCDFPKEGIHRQPSLQDVKPGNFSQLYPNSTRWYDPSTQATHFSGSRTRRSTLCAPRNSEYPVDNGVAYSYQSFTSSSTQPSISQEKAALFTQRYLHHSSSSTFNTIHDSSSTATLNNHKTCPPAHRMNHDHVSSSSVHQFEKIETVKSRSRSQSKHTSRTRRHKSIIEIPLLPTILSPDHLQSECPDEVDIDIDTSTTEPHRGRHRSRSQDFRRRKLTKCRPQDTSINMPISPYAL